GLRSHAAPGTSFSARSRALRRSAADLRAVSRNCSPLPSPSLFPPPAERGRLPLRGRALRVAAALALERDAAVVRPGRARSNAASFHRAPAARFRALDQAKGALLPLRGDDARTLVCRRADLPALPVGPAMGRGGKGPSAWVDPDPAQPGARSLRRARLPRDLRLEVDRPQPVRGDPVAPCRLCLPLPPLRLHDRVEVALALVAARYRRCLTTCPVVRSRLHRQPLRGRSHDRLPLRRHGPGCRLVVLAPPPLARLKRAGPSSGLDTR